MSSGRFKFSISSMRLSLKLSVFKHFKSFNLSIVLFLFVYAWQSDLKLALAISVSLVAVVIIAGLVGTFIPLFLDRRDIDPAIATGPFITTSNDIFGIVIYLIISKFILGV